MSDRPEWHAFNQKHQRSAAGSEVIPWGSAAAHEAVNRICQEVAARCREVIATQFAANSQTAMHKSPRWTAERQAPTR